MNERDLLVEDSSDVVVGPNVFDRNPRYFSSARTAKAIGGILFRNSRDCTLTGLHVNGTRQQPGAVVLDIEDSVPPAHKSAAMALLKEEIAELRAHNTGAIVRIQPIGEHSPAEIAAAPQSLRTLDPSWPWPLFGTVAVS